MAALEQVRALFANGRIEEWLDCASITPADMCSPAFVPRIARLLRRFHALEVDLPRHPKAPWEVTWQWLAQAKALTFTDPVKKVRPWCCAAGQSQQHAQNQTAVECAGSSRVYTARCCCQSQNIAQAHSATLYRSHRLHQTPDGNLSRLVSLSLIIPPAT